VSGHGWRGISRVSLLGSGRSEEVLNLLVGVGATGLVFGEELISPMRSFLLHGTLDGPGGLLSSKESEGVVRRHIEGGMR
jgi:hypothetical protein